MQTSLLASGRQEHGIALRPNYHPERLLFSARLSEVLRRISFRDPETKKWYVFLTNNFSEPALKIAQLYRCRWNIELFFKWIKQHLRIKAFYGTSENAVRVQVWIAITVYLLVAIFKKRHRLPASLYTILQVLSVTLFEKTPILQAFSQYPLQTMNPNINNEPYLPGFKPDTSDRHHIA